MLVTRSGLARDLEELGSAGGSHTCWQDVQPNVLGALPHDRLTGEEDNVNYVARPALIAGYGNGGLAMESKAYLLEARPLVGRTTACVGRNLPPENARNLG